MLKIYSSMRCPDRVKYRDEDKLFAPVRAKGKIGIPCIFCEDGSVTLEWEEFM